MKIEVLLINISFFSTMNDQLFAKSVISWYNSNQRSLPWRETKDPYCIWLSEIILQQTRVNQGLTYYEKFVENYPTVFDLAAAKEDEVLRLWQGLGYYSRARNLHATAKYITKELNGVFPNSFDTIIKLKGVGDYTAAAIASFAFDEKVAVLDGNVFRVLSRYFGESADISDTKSKKIFQKIAKTALPTKNINTYNQAIMEFGALHCKPQSPFCTLCELQDTCYAFQHGVQDKLPVKTKKVKVKKRYFNYLIIEHNEQFFLQKRLKKDIWQNLYEFYLIEKKQEESIEVLLQEPLFSTISADKISIKKQGETIKHILSHQHIFTQFWHLKVNSEEFSLEEYEKFTYEEIENLPKPILLAKHFEKNF